MWVQIPPGCYDLMGWGLSPRFGCESPQVSGLPSRGLFLAFPFCPWYSRRARRNRAIVEFSKEILKLGQRWKRADGKVVTVLRLEDRSALIGGIWYHYHHEGQSNIHYAYPMFELLRLLPDEEEVTEAPADKPEDNAVPSAQETEAQEQHITVVSRFSNSVHNYPSLGYAVVHINGLQIEVDFNERELTVQDNSNLHEPLSDL